MIFMTLEITWLLKKSRADWSRYKVISKTFYPTKSRYNFVSAQEVWPPKCVQHHQSTLPEKSRKIWNLLFLYRKRIKVALKSIQKPWKITKNMRCCLSKYVMVLNDIKMHYWMGRDHFIVDLWLYRNFLIIWETCQFEKLLNMFKNTSRWNSEEVKCSN